MFHFMPSRFILSGDVEWSLSNCVGFWKCFVVFQYVHVLLLMLLLLTVIIYDDDGDDDDDDVYPDNTTTIVVSSVVGAVALIVLGFVFQVVRWLFSTSLLYVTCICDINESIGVHDSRQTMSSLTLFFAVIGSGWRPCTGLVAYFPILANLITVLKMFETTLISSSYICTSRPILRTWL